MKNSLIAIIVGVIVIAGGTFLLFGGNKETQITNESGLPLESNRVNEVADNDVPESFTGNLKQLFAFGKDVTCTFSNSDEQIDQTGTIYISGNSMRGDFVMQFKQDGGEMNASTIQKDDFIYSWGSSPFGDFATKLAVQKENRPEKKEGLDFDKNINYRCQKWRVDNSKFILPDNVNFNDINQELNQINADNQQLLDMQCDTCDEIPNPEAKAQCLAALGC